MIAVDTNVLVRFLVADDPKQATFARVFFAENRVAVPHTVLLEAEWVLRRSFKFGPREIASAFLRLLGIATVACRQSDAVLGAIGALQQGCDFADALHAYLAAPDSTAFATFDRELGAHARRIEGFPSVHLLGSEDSVPDRT